MKNLSLSNKISVITGATKGIGAEIARLFAEAGSKVAIIGRSEDKGIEVKSQIEKACTSKCVFYRCDVANYAEVKATSKKILIDFGGVDILVCNAGYASIAPLNEMKIEEWEKAIDINLSGVFYFIRSFINSMLEKKKGNIIIIGSSTTATGSGGGVHYAASKAGLLGIVKGVSYELLSRGIRINIITPAVIDTPLLRERYPDTKEVNEKLARQIPLGRIGKSEDIANIALFLASDLSEYICGQEIIADGGRILYRHPEGSK
ncbi:MAG: SDR family oxidoreductase [Actinobacteria bacterium]|nr:SDR family oxidoreductase [Actinomycetota bacterium]